jgi:two-component system, chemotaxis family, sensor kinase CheA
MDDLLREFVGETLDMMESVAGDLLVWEADPADRSGLDGIFRTVHTVKGSSSFFDLPRITAVAHAAEELLDALRARRSAPDAAAVAAILSAFERIRHLTQAIAAGGGEPAGDDAALIAEILANLRGSTGPVNGAAPAEDVPAMTHPEPVGLGEFAEHPAVVPQNWRSVRLPVALLDELMNGVSDLVLARNEVAAQLRAAGIDPAALSAFDRLSATLAQVRSSVGQMRMVPLRQLFAPLPRLVRQLSAELGKDVRLVIDGGEVEIDREVGESLRDPIVHVLRNAIDHGIENAERRIAADKPKQGMLRVSARQANNRILIAFEDDGGGLPLDSLVRRAIDGGHVAEDEAARLSPDRIAEFVFLPGVSTAAAVTGVSGRGVGMDVVKANVEKLGGHIHVCNRPGAGVTFEFDVPMTLTIISALAIDAGGQSFAIPRSAVHEVLLASSDSVQRQSAGGAGLVRVRGRMLPLLVLEDILGLPEYESAEDRAIILCRIGSNATVAIDAPDVRDHEELVIKPLPPLLLALGIYSGMSLPDSGQPMLVLDVESIASGRILADQGEEPAPEITARRDTDLWLTCVATSGERCIALPMALIERLHDLPVSAISRIGERRVAMIDGQLVPVALTGDLPDEGSVRMVRIGDGVRRIAIPVAEVGQMLPFEPELPAESGLLPLLGLSQHDGTLIELIDAYTLLADAVAVDAKAGGRTLSVVDPHASQWVAGLLVPMLAAAGYASHIVRDASEVAAGTPVITLDGEAHLVVASGNGSVLTVDRYDRAALLDALAGPEALRQGRGAKA